MLLVPLESEFRRLSIAPNKSFSLLASIAYIVMCGGTLLSVMNELPVFSAILFIYRCKICSAVLSKYTDTRYIYFPLSYKNHAPTHIGRGNYCYTFKLSNYTNSGILYPAFCIASTKSSNDILTLLAPTSGSNIPS